MSIKLSSPNKPQEEKFDKFHEKHVSYRAVLGNIPGLSIGLPLGGIPRATYAAPVIHRMPPAPIPIPGSGLKRAVNYYADYGGCGIWRMYWPEHYLNAYQKAVVSGLSTMILEPRFYNGLGAVKLQRQATPVQAKFVQFLKMASKEFGFKVIYEIDDIVFREDIPDYNRCKDSFTDPKITESVLEMMQTADEISVTNEFMRNYYIEKTGNKKITVLPNYPPKNWIDRFYNHENIMQRLYSQRSKPRIGYMGSGTHFDVENRVQLKDDFAHVVDFIIKTRKDFTWVFLGGHPLQCMPFVSNKEMEFHPWVPIYDLPSKIDSLNLNTVIAPLQDNIFNKSKSNIKYLEAACLGIPGVFQDLVTYKDAPVRFSTGEEMVSKLKNLLKDDQEYLLQSRTAREYAETMWLESENNLMKHHELYFTPFGSKDRKFLLETNIQP